ncbi:MAG: hypothetical protein COV52_06945 [Gammaproteobacteria bacterium CG11_big_fil_rev_8_21_14_0_20_46_22]|nr:MAG: hypothetical protein COW05_06350 [Gammaproteobacteria bacterium CG12_big_fil_rev_8_21_14_0_65_46_12]PIR10777.1 MAG: hypothetical protein COV52_06945 [Gammaproteobacteria bacterium CG11_big_fil_rev_8_21_14_0_20_46_22]
MWFVRFFLSRPLVTVLLAILVCVAGWYAYRNTSVEHLPNTTPPIIKVSATWHGASAEAVDQSVTQPLNKQLMKISKMTNLFSISFPNISLITGVMNLSVPVNDAYQMIQNEVGQVQSSLPGDVRITVKKFSNSNVPIMWLFLRSGQYSVNDLSFYAEHNIVPDLSRIPGVAGVNLVGAGQRSVQVFLDPVKMSAYGIDLQQVFQAFNTRNISIPGGFVTTFQQRYLLNLDLKFYSLLALENMIITYRDHAPIFLKDIANVKLTAGRNQAYSALNGEQGIALGIVKSNDTNTFSVLSSVDTFLNDDVITDLPNSVHLSIPYDAKRIIEDTLGSLKSDIVWSVLFAALVVFIFLRRLAPTLVVVAIVPLSLLGGLVVLYVFDYSINMLTLLSLILLVGVVVDDVIVVVEAVEHVGESATGEALPRSEVVLRAMSLIIKPVIASSISLVCIFVAVFFLPGILGIFLKVFALVVVSGVLFSLFFALSLSPILCQYLPSQPERLWFLTRFLKHAFSCLDQAYTRLVQLCLKGRILTVVLVVLLCVPAYFLMGVIGSGFLPAKQNNSALEIEFKTPHNSGLEYTLNRAKLIEARVKASPFIYSNLLLLGQNTQNQGTIIANLKQVRDTDAAIDTLSRALSDIPGTEVTVAGKPFVSGHLDPLYFALLGKNNAILTKIGQDFSDVLDKHPDLGRLSIDAPKLQAQYRLEVNRALISSMGITPQAVAQVTALYGGDIQVGSLLYKGSGVTFPIYLSPEEGSLTQPNDLHKIYMYTPSGQFVPLSSVAKLVPSVAFSQISRINDQVDIQFSGKPKKSLGLAIAEVKALAKKHLPAEVKLLFLGQSESYLSVASGMLTALGIGLLMLYVVLAVQFNSLIQPVVIMLAQPLAAIGAIYGLWLAHIDLNIYSMIGVLLLMGLVAKNSILLISLTNELRREGLSINEALQQACPRRMRPVIMTSLTIILAMIPAVFGTGIGSEGDRSLGVAVIFGMLASTILTLILVPCVYSLLEQAMEVCLRRGRENS